MSHYTMQGKKFVCKAQHEKLFLPQLTFLFLATGSSSCVGMVGATLGGGVGRYNGLHGMILDSLLSVRMVTANGDIVVASATENEDLFWGIRGAGFNYGIIVSAEYQVYNLTSSFVMNADMIFPASANATIFNYLKSYETSLPAKLAFILEGGFNKAFGGVRQNSSRITGGTADGASPFLALHPDQRRLRRMFIGRHSSNPTTAGPSAHTKKHLRSPMERPHQKRVLRSRRISRNPMH